MSDFSRVFEPVPAVLMDEMRRWIGDCVWVDLEPHEIEDLSDRTILLGVERRYSGGIDGFKTDCAELVA